MSGTRLFHKRIPPLLLPHPRRNVTCFSLTVLFFEKKSRQKKLQLSGSLCRALCLPCVRGGGPRSGGRDLRVCEAHLQASPRGVRKPRSGWRFVKKQSLTAFGGAPFTQGSRKTLIFNQLRLCRTTSLCFSLLSFLSAPWFVMFTKNSGNLYCKTVENVV